MSINLVAISSNLQRQEELALLGQDIFKAIKNKNMASIKLLNFIDAYEKTFFNKKQLTQIKKEIEILKIQSNFPLKELGSLDYAVTKTLETPYFDYLVFVGD